MQNFEDLREILTAIQDLGNEWQTQNVSLRAENSRLQSENIFLRDQNDQLRRKLKDLSDENKRLEDKLNDLRDELITQLDADKRDNQEFIKRYFGANVSSRKTQTDAPSPSSNADRIRTSNYSSYGRLSN